MANGLSVGGVGGLNLSDPYLIQAMNYQPQYSVYGLNNQASLMQNQEAQVPYASQPVQTNFKATPSAEQNIQGTQKKKSKAGLVLAGVAIVGLGILFHKKGKADLGLVERIKDGAKTCYKGVFGKVTKVASAKAPELTKTIEADGVKKAVLNDGIKLKSYVADIDGYKITYINDHVTEVLKDGESILSKYQDKASTTVRETIDNYIAQFDKGQNLDKLSDLKIKYRKSNAEHYLFHRQNPTSAFQFVAGLKRA